MMTTEEFNDKPTGSDGGRTSLMTNPTPDLLPCPFCGGDAGSCPDANHSTGWDVGCFSNACEIEPHVWAVHKSTAVMQWNTRIPTPATSAGAVTVKKLAWDQCQSTLPRVVFEAKSCFGRYVTWPNGNWKLYGAYGYEQEGDLNSAQAAAQADYAARIMSAIETTPDPRNEVIARLVEALGIGVNQYGAMMTVNSAFYDEARSSLAAAKEVMK